MQKLRYSRYLKGVIIIMDIIILSIVFLFFFLERSKELQINPINWEENALSIALLSLFWILLSGRTKLYFIPRNLTYTLYLERIISHMLIFLFGIVLLGKVSNNIFLKNERFGLSLILFFSIFIIKSFIFFSLKSIRKHGINHRNIMFLGNESDSKILLEKLIEERKDYGYKIFHYPDTEIHLEKLKEFWKTNGIHTVFIPTHHSGFSKEEEWKIYDAAEKSKVRISLIPNILHDNYFSYDLAYIVTQPILKQAKFPLDYFSNYIIKRGVDIIFSLLILVLVCSWLFPVIALLIYWNDKGPVFFKQKRYGYHEEIFHCIKFRTMVQNSESTTKTTQENDSRITKIGKFLRKTSLDEMPQFINVLLGEMSVVGPRPHMLLVDNYYKPKIGKYTVRSMVKPGITGLAQVNGLRGDNGNMEIEMQKRILADAFYVKNWSLVLDLVIILKTIILLIKGDKKAR